MAHVTIDEFIHKLAEDKAIADFGIIFDNDRNMCSVTIVWKDATVVNVSDVFPRIAVRKAYEIYRQFGNIHFPEPVQQSDIMRAFGLSVDDVNPMHTGVNAEDVSP